MLGDNSYYIDYKEKKMIKLDYQTNNPRWGMSGIKFTNWKAYSKTIGFLSNLDHYKTYGKGSSIWQNSISIILERNDLQGAYEKEGRIHYYKEMHDLSRELVDLNACHSAGNSPVTCRMNSNGFMRSLVEDFSFQMLLRSSQLTADIIPPSGKGSVKSELKSFFTKEAHAKEEILEYMNAFDTGYNL